MPSSPLVLQQLPGARARLARVERFLLEQLASGAREVFLVAPNRLSARRLLRDLATRQGRLGFVRPYTLRELARELALPELVARGLVPLAPRGERALSATVIAQADLTPSSLGAAIREHDGLRRRLAEAIGDLRRAEVTPAELRAAPGGGSGREQALATLLEKYEQAKASAGAADQVDVLRLARARLADAPPLAPALVLLDPRPRAPLEASLCAGLASWATASLVLTPLRAEPAESRLREAGFAVQTEGDGARATNLTRARQHLFATRPGEVHAPDEHLVVQSAPDPALEAIEVVRYVTRLAEAGVAFDEVAVLLPSPEQYLPLFQEAFARAEVPARLLPGPPVPEPAGRTLRLLLRVGLEGGSVSRFLEAHSLGQLDLLSPGCGRGRTERVLVESGIVEGSAERWRERLELLANHLEQRLVAAEREDGPSAAIERDLEATRSLLENAVPLVATLISLAGQTRGWAGWAEALDELVGRHFAPTRALSEHLDSVAQLEGLGEIDLLGVVDLLDVRLGHRRGDPGPDRGGRVTVMPVDSARGCSYRHVLVPGAVEGTFPGIAREDPLLFDGSRRRLRGDDFAHRSRRTQDQRDLLRVALDAAGEGIRFSFPRIDPGEGRPQAPSYYLFLVLAAGEAWRGGLQDLRDRALDPEGARLDRPVAADPRRATAPVEFDLALALGAGGREALVRHLDAVDGALEPSARSFQRGLRREEQRPPHALGRADGLVTPSPTLLAAVRARGPDRVERPVSPTSLERFATCPYQFFLQHVVRLRELEAPEPLRGLDALTRGSLVHEVVRRFLSEVGLPAHLGAGSLPDLMHHLEQVFDDLCGELYQEHAVRRPVLLEAALGQVRRDLRSWLRDRAREAGEEGWEIRHCELGFGLGERGREQRDPHSTPTPVEVTIAEQRVFLRGQIDQVEATRGRVRVTDLKTGRARVEPGDRVQGGRSLQRPLYALAYARLQAEAGASAPTQLSGRLQFLGPLGEASAHEVPLDADLREDVRLLLAAVAHAFRDGLFPALPAPALFAWRKAGRDPLAPDARPECPPFCAYLSVCGPTVPGRARRVQTDPRLLPLHQLRSRP